MSYLTKNFHLFCMHEDKTHSTTITKAALAGQQAKTESVEDQKAALVKPSLMRFTIQQRTMVLPEEEKKEKDMMRMMPMTAVGSHLRPGK